MKKWMFSAVSTGCILVISILLLASVGAFGQDLLSYVQKPDDTFRWYKASETATSGGRRTVFNMTSQTWQGIPWKHALDIFVPADCKYSETSVLIVAGGSGGGAESGLQVMLANMTMCPVAVLHNIPNQPLYNNLREDALIAYTFRKMLETGDRSWPLLLPMTKSAVRAMDVLEAYSARSMPGKINKFIVGGASKRGWTTWLTAAADPVRVKGIIPMVYDNLNLQKQMELQIDAYGTYSEEIEDYTEINLQQQLSTKKGRELAKIVDPLTYLDRIKMPKLIINGSNDPYWNAASMNIYWNDLKGSKYVLYVPNAGHGLSIGDGPASLMTIVASMSAFVESVASDSAMPKLSWKYKVSSGKCYLDIKSSAKGTTAGIWVAHSSSRDFRQSQWKRTELEARNGSFTGTIKLPDSGFTGVFGEMVLPGTPDYNLSTQVCVLSKQGIVRP